MVPLTTSNPIREALSRGRFSYIVELVASAKTTVEHLQDIAAGLAQIPGVIAGGVTSYAGGSAGLDPIGVGAATRARGLTPNVHLTCVNHSRKELIRSLEELNSLGIENVFAITGDYPKVGTVDPAAKVDFDVDSVQLIEMIHEMRQRGLPFHISAAVSPFKYTEADCAYQYLKLEKKIAAGADFAVTQLGYDVRKFRELKRYLDERRLKTPVFGNVYILAAGAARKFSKGEPPGCWVSQELVEIVQEEAKASDKGLAARLERAARTIAVLRGLGYAGAYIGGDHQAERIRWVIERSEAIASNWEQYAEELVFAPKDGFYFFDSPKPAPKKRELAQQVMDVIEPANTPAPLRTLLTGILGWVDHHPSAAHALERAEFAFKSPAFGCQACGNCVLGLMEYVCPMTCPKNLRNGPCGGTLNGQCEVFPDKPCVWVKVYERAQAANRVEELKVYIPQRDRSLEGTSSYINYYLGRDSRPEHPQPLITINGTGASAKAAPEG